MNGKDSHHLITKDIDNSDWKNESKSNNNNKNNNDSNSNNNKTNNNKSVGVVVRTSSYVREATEWMALLQNLTSMMLASSSISHTTEKAKWSVRIACVRADIRKSEACRGVMNIPRTTEDVH